MGTGDFMVRHYPWIYLTMFLAALPVGSVAAHKGSLTPILNASPTLAPLQHVRFCLRYPSDCKSDPAQDERIDLTTETWELLKRVNHSVNMSITPTPKSYGLNLEDRWRIAPEMGDCNDYAVTKRYELLGNG